MSFLFSPSEETSYVRVWTGGTRNVREHLTLRLSSDRIGWSEAHRAAHGEAIDSVDGEISFYVVLRLEDGTTLAPNDHRANTGS